MNAALKVPSAKSRLKVLGNLKATKKASAKTEAPKNIAINLYVDRVNVSKSLE